MARSKSMGTSVTAMEVISAGRKEEGMDKCFQGTGGHFDDANVMPAAAMRISEANMHK